MATVQQHVKKAQDNETFALSIDVSTENGRDWAITVLFYVAVHYVQAYFVKQKISPISQHTQRDSAIRRDSRLRKIYHDYRELETHSRDARYDISGFTESDLASVKTHLSSVKTLLVPLI